MYSGEGEIDPWTRIVGTRIEHCDDHRNPTVIDKAYPQALAHLIATNSLAATEMIKFQIDIVLGWMDRSENRASSLGPMPTTPSEAFRPGQHTNDGLYHCRNLYSVPMRYFFAKHPDVPFVRFSSLFSCSFLNFGVQVGSIFGSGPNLM